MNGPDGYNIRYKDSEGTPVVVTVTPSTQRHAIDVAIALDLAPRMHDLEVWRSGRKVWPLDTTLPPCRTHRLAGCTCDRLRSFA